MKVNEMTFLLSPAEVNGTEYTHVALGELHRNTDGYIIIVFGEIKTRCFVSNEDIIEHNGIANVLRKDLREAEELGLEWVACCTHYALEAVEAHVNNM